MSDELIDAFFIRVKILEKRIDKIKIIFDNNKRTFFYL